MAQNESKGPVILFFGTLLVLAYSENQMLSEHAGEITLGLMLIGWLAIKMLGHATARLGKKAWLLILQLAVWYALFLWLVPADPNNKILILWGVGTLLGFAGAGARLIHERFPRVRAVMEGTSPRALALACITGALGSGLHGSGFWLGLFATLIACLLAAIPFYYGWHLAEPLPRGQHDARFGTGESYRKAGMSDER
jgi:hypothetical protein